MPEGHRYPLGVHTSLLFRTNVTRCSKSTQSFDFWMKPYYNILKTWANSTITLCMRHYYKCYKSFCNNVPFTEICGSLAYLKRFVWIEMREFGTKFSLKDQEILNEISRLSLKFVAVQHIWKDLCELKWENLVQNFPWRIKKF